MPGQQAPHFAVSVLAVLLDRLRPIVAQRQKDHHRTLIHTSSYDVPYRPSIRAMVNEAVEYICDLYVPIESTPPERLTAAGRLALEYLPTNIWAPPVNRDQWIINYAEALKKALEEPTTPSASPEGSSPQEGEASNEKDEFVKCANCGTPTPWEDVTIGRDYTQICAKCQTEDIMESRK